MPVGNNGDAARSAQQALSAVSVGRSQGSQQGGGAFAALVQQAQQSQSQFDKLIQTVQKLQQENAIAVQQAGQSAASGATEAANAVARQIDQQNQKAESKREKLDDRQFSEDMARLQAKLQKDAVTEAQAMGQSIQAQRDNMARFTQAFDAKRADFDESVAVYSARTDEMLAQGFFDSTAGRAEFKQRLHLIDMMRANGDDHFDDRHLEAAFSLHNENVQRIIDGRDPRDLSQLRVDPLQLPMPETKSSGRAIAPEGSIPPERMFEMKIMGGYPARGVVFNDEENFGLPEGYSPRFVDAATMLEGLSRDDAYRVTSDASLRRELTRKNQEIVVKSMDRLEPLMDQYKSFNTTFNSMAPGAVDAALQEFLADTNPHKFDDIGRTIMAGSLKNIFGGGRNGEKMALRAMQLFDGKAELGSGEEAFLGMALESASFNIRTHLLSEIQSAGGEGESLATQLVSQLVATHGEDGAAAMLGVPNTGVGLVSAQDKMQQNLTGAYAFANRMHNGLWQQSVLETFRKDIRKFTRMSDVFAFKQVKEGSDQRGRVLQLLGKDEAFSQIQKNVEGSSPEDLEDLVSNRDTSALDADFGILDTMIQLSDELGPDVLNGVSAMITGGVETPDSPNLQAYLSQSRVESRRSGFSAAAGGRARFSHDRQMRARKRQAQNPTTGESFQEGGAIGVVLEQVPALLSMAPALIGSGIERVAAGTLQNIAGRGAAGGFVRNLRKGQKKLGAVIQPLFGGGDGLTDEEKRQTIGEGQ